MEAKANREASWAPSEITSVDVRYASWIAFFAWVFAVYDFILFGTLLPHHVTFQNSLVILILSNVVGYCGYLAHGYLGDKIGRRNVIAIGWTIAGVVFSLMLFGPSSFFVVVTLYSLGLFFLIGPYSARLFFIGESYPTAIRATGGTFVSATGPIGAILAGLGATAILSSGGEWRTAAFFFGAIPCFVSGLLVLAAQHVDPKVLK